jgi:hypothetical protein
VDSARERFVLQPDPVGKYFHCSVLVLHLKNFWGELRFHRAFRVQAGNFKLPVSAERLTSAAKTDFVERSRISEVVLERFVDPLLAPEAGRRGNYVTFLMRMQI